MREKSWFREYGLILAAGVAVGIAALILTASGNPKNMGFCIACFLRDIADDDDALLGLKALSRQKGATVKAAAALSSRLFLFVCLLHLAAFLFDHRITDLITV